MAGRALDTLATRIGVALSILLMATICGLAVLSVQKSVERLEESHRVFSDRQLRNGFVAMSDIKRLLLIAHEAAVNGGYDQRLRGDFQSAVDILFVRKDNFRRVLRAGSGLPSAADAIASIEQLIAIADGALASGLQDVDGLWRDLLEESENARRKLVVFLDDMDRLQNGILDRQSAAVRRQTTLVQASLAGISFIGIVALLLLRREVMARRARERAERDVEFLAYFDPLTRLPNRTQFQRRLAEILDAGGPAALILIDLDEFKGVNDTYGHAAGDTVLKHVAGLLSRCTEASGGFSARLGGDEFAIVIEDVDTAALTRIADALLRQAAVPVVYEGESLRVGLSIGIATSLQVGNRLEPTVDSLSRVTDFALYASKTGGRNRVTLYDASLERRFLERRAMVEDLPAAIADGSLDVFLQPKVTLPDASVYGFEALVRWRRNGRLIPPEEFITIAEESGLIFEVDRYVMRTVTRLIADFNARHATRLSISVNLSALHFSSERIVGWIHEALEQSGLDPVLLTLEITETVQLRDWSQVSETIDMIRKRGTRISIDDFGAGYSSLGYLRSTLADEVKIDRSLVDQIETSEQARFLLDGVLEMANNLKLAVVVEGVESVDQARTIHDMGARMAQGFLFGRPAPAAEALSRHAAGVVGAAQLRNRA